MDGTAAAKRVELNQNAAIPILLKLVHVSSGIVTAALYASRPASESLGWEPA